MRYKRETYADRASWLRGRSSIPGSTGASDAAARMGLSPWETIDELYDRAIGLKPARDLSGNAAVKFGTEAEDPIRRLVALDLGADYQIEHHPFDILRLADKPWIFATLDGEATRKSSGARGGIEIKTGSYRSARDLAPWNDGMPEHYFAQVCQQLVVTGWPFWIVAARLRKDPFAEEDGPALPDIKWIYRYIEASDPDVQESMKAVEESADDFHTAVICRKRPCTWLSSAGISY